MSRMPILIRILNDDTGHKPRLQFDVTMDLTSRRHHRLTIFDLPDEILLQIFEKFGSAGQVATYGHDRSWRLPESKQPSDPQALQNSRLVCGRLNALVAPLICPVPRVSLEESSLNRLEQLTRNPLIAAGVCGLNVNLRCRPALFAQSLRRYHAHVQGIIDKACGSCDYHTEFGNYAAEDESANALQHRAYLKASRKLWRIRESWSDYVDVQEPVDRDEQLSEDDNQAAEEAADYGDDPIDQGDDQSDYLDDERDPTDIGALDELDFKAYQNLLQENFNWYVKRHDEQTRMITDGSFVRILTEVLSRCRVRPYVWLGDEEKRNPGFRTAEFDLAHDMEYLSIAMKAKSSWLDIEGLSQDTTGEESPSLPARVLVELPIQCKKAGVSLRGLSIGCFPMTKGFSCVLPPEHNDNIWTSLATACQSLEVLHFGVRGMNHRPWRPSRMSASDCGIVDGYISAVCSGSQLQVMFINMSNFRADNGKRRQHGSARLAPDLYHRAAVILNGMTSHNLRQLHLMYLEMSGNDLEAVVTRLSDSSLRNVYLCSITLHEGAYVEVMNVLRQKVAAQSRKPEINLTTLQGAEFGAPTKFDDGDNMFMFSGDKSVHDAFWSRLEEYQHPASLELVQRWVNDPLGKELNPLLPD